jgi:hypothetical protein
VGTQVSLCIVNGHQCDCQPDSGTPCHYGTAADVQARLNRRLDLWKRIIDKQRAEIERLRRELEAVITAAHKAGFIHDGKWQTAIPAEITKEMA